MAAALLTSGELIARGMVARNAVSASFFERQARPLAAICQRMAERFERGGRLVAFGVAHSASDAQHIAVEFLHPVLVGKRALPALDLSATFPVALAAVVRADDIVVGFGSCGGDAQVDDAIRHAMAQGALALALPGTVGDYVIDSPSADPFVHQELIEILYHTLWETVHVFFEHRSLDDSGGAASFLYPFLGGVRASSEDLIVEVARSIRAKAVCVERLRDQVAAGQSDQIADAVRAIQDAIAAGGTIFAIGNGGSATDAADFALDACASPKGYAPVPAISLASDAATLTAIANDIGSEAIFSRLLMACARRGDAVLAFSTSGGSPNLIAALAEARSRGLLTIAIVGYDGGEVLRRRLADHVIVVNGDQIPRIQEAQASMYHVMLDLLEHFRHQHD